MTKDFPKTYAPGDRVKYIGHTDACRDKCGAPCCPPNSGCPWADREGKMATVQSYEDCGTSLPVLFDGEEFKVFLRYEAHVSSEKRTTILAMRNHK